MEKLSDAPVGLILGAGFSHVAGIPLTREIFNTDVFVVSKRSEKRFEAVWGVWQKWKKSMQELYRNSF